MRNLLLFFHSSSALIYGYIFIYFTPFNFQITLGKRCYHSHFACTWYDDKALLHRQYSRKLSPKQGAIQLYGESARWSPPELRGDLCCCSALALPLSHAGFELIPSFFHWSIYEVLAPFQAFRSFSEQNRFLLSWFYILVQRDKDRP